MSQLNDLLRSELAQVKAFIEALTDEQVALEQGDAEALPAIVSRKMALVQQLNTSEAERLREIGCVNQTAEKAQMIQWLAAHPQEVEAASTWQDILVQAAAARRQHETNGQLIALHLERTQEALAVLSQSAPADTKLYGADGQTAGPTGSRILDSA